LPVRPHLVGEEGAAAQVADPVALETGKQFADVLGRRRGAATQVDQDEAADDGAAYLPQPEAARVEVLDFVHVGSGAEVALEIVGPGVVWTAQPLADRSLLLLEEPRTAVAADVV